MKQTMKNLAITFGKKVFSILMAGLATMIGNFVLGLFGKGFGKFSQTRAERASRKDDAVIIDDTTGNSEESTSDDIVGEEIVDEADNQENEED